jgi:hypothetical protein
VRSTYLVECYWPGVERDAAEEALGRAVAGGELRCVDSILIPEDEIVLCVFEGSSADAVRDAARRSGLPSERVTPSIRLYPTGRENP